jgi:hypothetical protein
MRLLLSTFLVALFLSISVFAQTREQAIEKFDNLKNEGKLLEQQILSIDKASLQLAKEQGFGVFRILPREKYDKGLLFVRGGGAYYSFTKKSHSYNETPQISLEQNNLSVGFAGADYGFIANLGEMKLAELNENIKEVEFALNYSIPKLEPDVRDEKRKFDDHKTDEGILLKRRFPATVGHTFILRAITFDEADVLVAFNIHRKDTDGSLIIFWKLIKEFEKPFFLYQTDEDLTKQIEQIIKENGYENIKFEVKDGIIISKNKGKEQSIFSQIINTGKLRFRGVKYAPIE